MKHKYVYIFPMAREHETPYDVEIRVHKIFDEGHRFARAVVADEKDNILWTPSAKTAFCFALGVTETFSIKGDNIIAYPTIVKAVVVQELPQSRAERYIRRKSMQWISKYHRSALRKPNSWIGERYAEFMERHKKIDETFEKFRYTLARAHYSQSLESDLN